MSSGTHPTIAPFEGSRLVDFESYSYSSGYSNRLKRTTPISTIGYSAVTVDFQWYTDNGYSSYTTEGVTVQWSTDGSIWNNSTFFMRYSATNQWVLETVTLPAGAANQATLYVGFLFYCQDGNDCHMDIMHVKGLLPCTTPSASPTALILTPTTTTINVSYTAATGVDDYLAIRSLNSTLSATPVNGTTYTVGSSIGGGIVDYYGTGTTFTSTGLNPGTQYYYFIFSANDASCSGGPLYKTTSPLFGSTSTVPVVPISGTKTIPGNYATIAAAIAAINASGVGAGGVIFNVAPGYTETFLTPLAGYISPTLNYPTAANQVVFQKNGSGVNPLVTAPVGTGNFDAIIAFSGVNYVTFNGIDVQESAANTTAATQMEYGYAILKVSGTQGSQNITIKNCNITLNKANTNVTWGVYSNNGTTIAPTTALTVTAATGTNSNNRSSVIRSPIVTVVSICMALAMRISLIYTMIRITRSEKTELIPLPILAVLEVVLPQFMRCTSITRMD
jgi:hypothetical protein